MNGITWALLGTLFTFSVTSLGALNVFWVKKEVGSGVQCAFLGFAGGVMVAASVWSLLLPGIDRAEENNQIGWLVISGGFLLGVVALLFADSIMKKHYMRKLAAGQLASLRQSTTMLILAITIHNIPEGMAVGLAFALAMSEACGSRPCFQGPWPWPWHRHSKLPGGYRSGPSPSEGRYEQEKGFPHGQHGPPP